MGATCSCILQQVFKKIAGKINLIGKPLKVNTASGATLGPIRIAPLDLNIEQNFTEFCCVYKIEATLHFRTGFCSKVQNWYCLGY